MKFSHSKLELMRLMTLTSLTCLKSSTALPSHLHGMHCPILEHGAIQLFQISDTWQAYFYTTIGSDADSELIAN